MIRTLFPVFPRTAVFRILVRTHGMVEFSSLCKVGPQFTRLRVMNHQSPITHWRRRHPNKSLWSSYYLHLLQSDSWLPFLSSQFHTHGSYGYSLKDLLSIQPKYNLNTLVWDSSRKHMSVRTVGLTLTRKRQSAKLCLVTGLPYFEIIW